MGAEGGNAIAVAARNALDESVEAQTPQVIGGLAGSVVAVVAQQLCDAVAHVAMAKSGRVESEQTQRLHQGQNPAVAEAEAGGALAVDADRLADGINVALADETVVAQVFDAQQAPVGGEADLPQCGQIDESPADGEVVGIVDGGFGPQGLTFFVVLLDLGFLVLDMERGDHALGEDPGAKRAGRPAGDAAVEDQLHSIGASDVEILPNDFFKETPAGVGPVQHLG